MAVFTQVSEDQARALLERLNLGQLTGLRGIQGGIENTNYFLDTTQGHWVLTLFCWAGRLHRLVLVVLKELLAC